MKNLPLLTVFFLVASNIVFAETLRVRSGEHANFTRFTINIPPGSVWKINQFSQEFELIVDIENAEYDLSGIFSRIPRTRVVDVDQKGIGGPLKFTLNCYCSVNPSLFENDLIVIDVSNAKASNLTAVSKYKPTRGASHYRFASRFPELDLITQDYETASVGTAVEPNSQLQLPQLEDGRNYASSLPTETVPISEFDNIASIVERRLIEEIEQARVGGSLYSESLSNDLNSGYGKNNEDDGRSLKDEESFSAGGPGLNLNYRNALDESLLRDTRGLREGKVEKECDSEGDIEISSWVGKDDSYSQQLSFWRARLYGEFDRVNDVAAINLAKIQLHFGFGAEAFKTLMLSGAENSEREILVELARIIEEPGVYASPMFEGQHVCDQNSALWAVLTRPDTAASSNHEAVIRSVDNLPKSLKEHLGAAVSQIFLTENEPDVSDSILRILNRGPEHESFSALLAEARTAELKGHNEIAGTKRELVARSNTMHSPKALVHLVSKAVDERGTLDPEIIDLVSSYEREFKGTDVGFDLARAKILGNAILGNFRVAVKNFRNISTSDEGSSLKDVRNDLLMILTERASDAEFIEYGLLVAGGFENELDGVVREEMSARLLNLGLSRVASGLLTLFKAPDESNRSKVLRARAALLENLPYEALDAISGMSQPEAIKLRAEAMLQVKRYSEAAELFTDVGELEIASRSFWLAGQPEKVSDEEGGEYGQISRVTKELGIVDSSVPEVQPLQRARELLMDSGDVRSNISELLGHVQLSE